MYKEQFIYHFNVAFIHFAILQMQYSRTIVQCLLNRNPSSKCDLDGANVLKDAELTGVPKLSLLVTGCNPRLCSIPVDWPQQKWLESQTQIFNAWESFITTCKCPCPCA
jgi:hypothetical protein